MASNTHSVIFYGLSTCIHCKNGREFLEKNNVPFELFYVDLAEGQERDKLLEEVRKHNPHISFPTIVIDDSTTIVGFRPDALSKALEI